MTVLNYEPFSTPNVLTHWNKGVKENTHIGSAQGHVTQSQLYYKSAI